jgi:GDP-L-fucose synthase
MLEAYWREYGLKSCLVLPTNLYGPGDNFDPKTSHVIPALIRKCLEAIENGRSTVTCWGTGAASREFLYVDDAAEAIIRATERIDVPEPINLGTGNEITIKELVHIIGRSCGFEGEYEWNSAQPDGQPRRCLDTTRADRLLEWKAGTDLADGIAETVSWYRSAAG